MIGKRADRMEGIGPMPIDPTLVPARELTSHAAPDGAMAFIAD